MLNARLWVNISTCINYIVGIYKTRGHFLHIKKYVKKPRKLQKNIRPKADI